MTASTAYNVTDEAYGAEAARFTSVDVRNGAALVMIILVYGTVMEAISRAPLGELAMHLGNFTALSRTWVARSSVTRHGRSPIIFSAACSARACWIWRIAHCFR
jgi:hypothetical protein